MSTGKQIDDRLAKAARLSRVNDLIRCIGSCGRQFFYSEKHSRYAFFELDERNRIWFNDDHSDKRIYTHHTNGRWKGFSHGGTMRNLVIALRNYIQSGKQLHARAFGPWADWIAGGDLWGYGDEMEIVREKAREIGIVPTEVEALRRENELLRKKLADQPAKVTIEMPGPTYLKPLKDGLHRVMQDRKTCTATIKFNDGTEYVLRSSRVTGAMGVKP